MEKREENRVCSKRVLFKALCCSCNKFRSPISAHFVSFVCPVVVIEFEICFG